MGKARFSKWLCLVGAVGLLGAYGGSPKRGVCRRRVTGDRRFDPWAAPGLRGGEPVAHAFGDACLAQPGGTARGELRSDADRFTGFVRIRVSRGALRAYLPCAQGEDGGLPGVGSPQRLPLPGPVLSAHGTADAGDLPSSGAQGSSTTPRKTWLSPWMGRLLITPSTA